MVAYDVSTGDSELDYYILRDSTRGMSYAKAVSPYAGECVEDLLIRAACENGFAPRMSHRLLHDEGQVRSAYAPGKKCKYTAEALTVLLGNPGGAAEIEAILPRDTPPRPGLRSFFGVWLENGTLTRHRRVSPLALRTAPYLRAVWRIWPLGFDPETKETLLRHCPVCKRQLGSTFMGDVWLCDRCNELTTGGKLLAVDLREYPQELIDERLWELLDCATCLVDPNALARRMDTRRKLHVDFRDMDDGAVFEFICALARSMVNRIDKRRMIGLPSSILAEATRVVLGWPDTFEALVSHHRKDGWLLYHPFAFLFYNHRLDRNLRERMKEITRLAIIRPFEKFAYGNRPVRSRIDRVEYSTLRRSHADASKGAHETSAVGVMSTTLRARKGVHAFSKSLGISVPTLMDMAYAEVFPSALLTDDEFNFEEQAELFVTRVQSKSCSFVIPDDAVRLPRAVATFFARAGDPWSNIFMAMISGHLPFWRTRENRRALLETVYVRDFEVLRQILKARQVTLDPHYSVPLSEREAAIWTRLWQECLALAIRAGLIEPPFTRASVGAFRSTFESSNFIQLRLRVGIGTRHFPGMRGSLESAGITPVLEGARGSAVWRRSEVEAHFGQMLIQCLT